MFMLYKSYIGMLFVLFKICIKLKLTITFKPDKEPWPIHFNLVSKNIFKKLNIRTC